MKEARNDEVDGGLWFYHGKTKEKAAKEAEKKECKAKEAYCKLL